MRKLLILSVLVVLTAGAMGCVQNPCSNTTWRPGYYLFGLGRSNQPTQADCCDPCGGGAVMSAPVMAAAPCCQ